MSALCSKVSNDFPHIKVRVLSVTYKTHLHYFSELIPCYFPHIHSFAVPASLLPEALIIQCCITKHSKIWQLKTKAVFSNGQDLMVSHSFCWSRLQKGINRYFSLRVFQEVDSQRYELGLQASEGWIFLSKQSKQLRQSHMPFCDWASEVTHYHFFCILSPHWPSTTSVREGITQKCEYQGAKIIVGYLEGCLSHFKRSGIVHLMAFTFTVSSPKYPYG